MTAVFKISNSGALQSVQLGVVDVVTTASAATSAWGWIGGLRGIQSIFRAGRSSLQGRSSVFSPPSILSSTCRVLTFNGIATFREETSEAFGGEYHLQMIGLTLCALSHELKNNDAINILMETLVPKRFRLLLDDFAGAREALYTQLVDNCAVILNEGASLGLPERFAHVASELHLERLYEDISSTSYTGARAHEHLLIGGLLNWIALDCPKSYLTRSALVLRIAAYLKDVGYHLGDLSTWSGRGTPPSGIRSVYLVLGGSADTDSHAEWDKANAFPIFEQISHYRYGTIGAMLLNTLQFPGKHSAEAFQDYFEVIERSICQSVTFTWKFDEAAYLGRDFHDGIMAVANYRTIRESSGSVAMRLAAFYFARCAELVAPCYCRIAQHGTLERVRKMIHSGEIIEESDSSLLVFRVITISIILTVFGQLGGVSFKDLRHCTRLSLQNPRMLRTLGEKVETLLMDGLSFADVATVLAYLHAGAREPDDLEELHRTGPNTTAYDGLSIIGYRNNSYSVLPALLSHLAEGPSQTALGFECFDSFIGNIPVWRDGTIKSTIQERVLYRQEQVPINQTQANYDNDGTGRSELAIQNALVTVPSLRSADVPLYLNIERPVELEGPVLGLCGRVHGTVVGNVGVPVILRTIVRSFGSDLKRTPQSCPKLSASYNSSPSKQLIVPASVWCKSAQKPTAAPLMHVYIPVQDDKAWALFLAGEVNSIICRCCADCAAGNVSDDDDAEDCVIIGYQG